MEARFLEHISSTSLDTFGQVEWRVGTRREAQQYVLASFEQLQGQRVRIHNLSSKSAFEELPFAYRYYAWVKFKNEPKTCVCLFACTTYLPTIHALDLVLNQLLFGAFAPDAYQGLVPSYLLGQPLQDQKDGMTSALTASMWCAQHCALHPRIQAMKETVEGVAWFVEWIWFVSSQETALCGQCGASRTPGQWFATSISAGLHRGHG